MTRARALELKHCGYVFAAQLGSTATWAIAGGLRAVGGGLIPTSLAVCLKKAVSYETVKRLVPEFGTSLSLTLGGVRRCLLQ